MIVSLRRRLWAAMIVVGLIATVGGWWSREPAAPHGDIPAAVADASRTASTPMDARLPAGGGAKPASAVAELHAAHEPSEAWSRERARAELKQRMQADWCGFGVAEKSRQIEAVFEKASAGGQPIGVDAIAEANRTAGAEVIEEAVAQVRQRWVKALLQRGDPRSLAVAEYLGGSDGDASRASVRLQALARSATDPMVTALALQRPCSPGCGNVDRAQWSRLEPANLQAWLTLLGDARTRHTQEAYVLERIANEARYSRTYEREFKVLLLELPQTVSLGLVQEAELQLIVGTASAWPIASLRPAMEFCRAKAAEPASQHLCLAVAELMWQGDNLLDRSLALALARQLLPARAGLRARWEPRARVAEAARHWAESNVAPWMSEVEAETSSCGWQAGIRRELQVRAAQGEWGQLQADMQAARADEASLSAKWRQGAGRSLLDPLPSARPASSVR
ncbi:MAG TPA: hypothetical protein VGE36_13385 [Roseateles sp.]